MPLFCVEQSVDSAYYFAEVAPLACSHSSDMSPQVSNGQRSHAHLMKQL